MASNGMAGNLEYYNTQGNNYYNNFGKRMVDYQEYNTAATHMAEINQN